LDDVNYEIRGPILQEANRMMSKGIDVLKLNIGNPYAFGFQAPDEVIHDMIYNIRDGQGYSDSKGLFSARKAIMQYCQLKKIPNVSIDDIFVGNGVSEMIMMAMQALLNHKDEILVPMPDYPLWTAAVSLSDGVPVHYQCDEEAEWYPDIDDIRKKITHRTRGIVIINPNNPTGALYPKEVLEQIVEVARESNLIIFCDEIYDHLVMDGAEHTSIATLAPDLLVVTFNGLSKSHRIAGFRSGWMIFSCNKRHAQGYMDGVNLLASMRLCANVPAQFVIQTALGGYQSSSELVCPGGRIYEQRECICNALAEIPGISFVKPKASFYIFPKLDVKKFNIKSDEKFALDFLRSKNILVVQGSGFNWPNNDHFRIVYLARTVELDIAMKKLGDFLSTYQQGAGGLDIAEDLDDNTKIFVPREE
ncbi:MAG: pyridoxal phosphate-dependent aminotransferase, partial [Clostridiales bacterium]